MDELLSTPNSDEMSLREALVAGGLSGARLGAAEAYFSVGAAIPPEELSARNASEIWHLRDSPQDPISGVSRPGNPMARYMPSMETNAKLSTPMCWRMVSTSLDAANNPSRSGVSTP